MTRSYQLDTTLDFGEIGVMPVSVEGHVHETGAFGPGKGYLQTDLKRVIAYISKSMGHNLAEVDVTQLISPGARSTLCEELEQKYLSESVQGEGA